MTTTTEPDNNAETTTHEIILSEPRNVTAKLTLENPGDDETPIPTEDIQNVEASVYPGMEDEVTYHCVCDEDTELSYTEAIEHLKTHPN